MSVEVAVYSSAAHFYVTKESSPTILIRYAYSILDKAFPVSQGKPPNTLLTTTEQWRLYQNLGGRQNFSEDVSF